MVLARRPVVLLSSALVAGAVALACVGEDPDAASSSSGGGPDSGPGTDGPTSGDGSSGGGDSTSSGTKHVLVAAGGHIGNPNLPQNLDTVLVAEIAPDGTIGDWISQAKPLPKPRSKAASVGVGRTLYLIGGTTDAVAGGNPTNDVLFTKLLDDGTIDAFATGTTFPMMATSFTATTDGSSIYVVGGSKLHTAKTMAAGVGGWTPTALDGTPGSPPVVFSKGSLIVTGGYTTERKVSRAVVTDGVAGAWAAETELAEDRSGHSSVGAGDYLYVLGGVDSNNAAIASVAMTKLAADGKPSTWSALGAMPGPRSLACAVAFNGFIYVIGGHPGQAAMSAFDTVFIGKTQTDGSIVWSEGKKLPSGRSELGCAAF